MGITERDLQLQLEPTVLIYMPHEHGWNASKINKYTGTHTICTIKSARIQANIYIYLYVIYVLPSDLLKAIILAHFFVFILEAL